MTVQLDANQQKIIELDTARHARVLGAPGSGKTTMIRFITRKFLSEGRMTPEELLVMDEQRTGATMLRNTIEQDLTMPLTGTLVRTPASLAFAIINEQQLATGQPEYTLLSGSREDDIVHQCLQEDIGIATLHALNLPEEARDNVQFRSELRDVLRVLDEAGYTPEQLSDVARRFEEHPENGPDVQGMVARWRTLQPLLTRIRAISHMTYPTERTTSESLNEATRLLSQAIHPDSSLVPRLLLLDRAADLSHGALSLIAQLVNHGTIVWAFGDPDASTMAYQGEASRLLRSMESALVRRGAKPEAFRFGEQHLTLRTVHRHGEPLRRFVTDLSTRLGTSGGWEHRQSASQPNRSSLVQFTTAGTFTQQIGMIAHRLRERYLGIGGVKVPWTNMAVICRSRDEVERVARALDDANVPTRIESGGMVLKRYAVARHLITLLQYVMGLKDLQANEMVDVLTGPICGLDPIAIRRLEAAIIGDERALAHNEKRVPRLLHDVLLQLIEEPNRIPDTAEGRALRKLQRMLKGGQRIHAQGGTPRQLLWHLWDATELQGQLRDRALQADRQLSTAAHETLDAVMQLFFTLQRHEEHISDVPIEDVLIELLRSDIPQDSIVTRSLRAAVMVTTPQGAAPHEFAVVCIAGPQEGVWPNLKPRSGATGAQPLEHFLQGGNTQSSTRTDTLHAELRLFLSACSRASEELLVVSREDEEEFPSAFFHLGHQYRVKKLPDTILTLRSYTAQLRRRITEDLADVEAARELSYLANEQVPGAYPDDWYGLKPPSTRRTLYEERVNSGKPVPVSPSQIEAVEQCPLNWFVSSLDDDFSSTHAQIGTLLHTVFERIASGNVSEMRSFIDAEWEHLSFESEWESHNARMIAHQMADGIAAYIADSRAQQTEVIANEGSFNLTLGIAELRGKADRIEHVQVNDGYYLPKIVDLKTGSSSPRQTDLEDHAQLLAYQLGIERAEFSFAGNPDGDQLTRKRFGESGGASLLFVHPAYQSSRRSYKVMEQQPMTTAQREDFIERVQEVARHIAASSFTARVEHHCDGADGDPACRLHIIPAVSYE